MYRIKFCNIAIKKRSWCHRDPVMKSTTIPHGCFADVPSTFKADVWQHFSWTISRNDNGEKETNAKLFANTAGRWSATIRERHQTWEAIWHITAQKSSSHNNKLQWGKSFNQAKGHLEPHFPKTVWELKKQQDALVNTQLKTSGCLLCSTTRDLGG